ncbi:MAG: leucine--tRNA ligase [Candidatus Thermoplasmatota archaeon]|nr:leucine--tRNA ligase [Candidatus Thermoplasmatota archaeon]
MALDFKAIERRWQSKWEETRIFEADVDIKKPKYFITYPYPYMNGYLHIGHAFTLLRCEILARYKRMRGFNVLFPFAFHCTGTPIVAAAARIKENEKEQIEILRDMGITEQEIPKFKDPIYWTEYFPKSAEEDLRKLGISVDWRRKFLTTYLNPYYDKFIEWQFRKLKAKNLVALGRHPVVWCNKCNSPVGDHDRLVGEGEVPVEFVLLKFKIANFYLVAATLRPETVFGQTNLWVNPDVEYVKIKVDNENWIVSNECSNKLAMQGYAVKVIDKIFGKELVGKYGFAPGIEKELIILPSELCDPKVGTGIVTSVPSDAPDDWIALLSLQRDEEKCKKQGLDYKLVKSIEPIRIIETPGFGNLPAAKICEQLNITSLEERKKLLKAKETIYKASFYSGIMKENCGKYSGMRVETAKELVKQELIAKGSANIMYELSGKVVCRCLTPSAVKIVEDQWFIKYGDKAWKSRVRKALDKLRVYPEHANKQFSFVVDWLEDWACARELGLGTRLPWDKKWIIESLSDSTIYMAYYTISKYLDYENVIKPDKLNDEFFEFVFLGVGDSQKLASKLGITNDKLKEIREEFEYWYPFDCRISGKDLIHNHLTFCLFTHVAIFPERYWPKSFGINGWILVDGAKMSKSAGNFYTLRQVLKKYCADIIRFTLGYGGEGLEDPNWSTTLASIVGKKLEQLYEFAISYYGKGRDEWYDIDTWFESILNRIVKDTVSSMEELNLKTALAKSYFDLQASLRWYLRRSNNVGNSELMKKFIETELKLLTPFIPHLCEEIWNKLGFKNFISTEAYPTYEESKINITAERSEKLLKSVIEDIAEILKVLRMKPKNIFIYTAPGWMYKVYEEVITKQKAIDFSGIVKKAITELSAPKAESPNYVKKLLEWLKRLNKEELEEAKVLVDEYKYLSGAVLFISKEFNCNVKLISCDEKEIYDPKGRAKHSEPFRPAIYIE